MSTCQGCSTTLPAPKKYGRDRKWCSERCRKLQYSRACVDCGATINVDGAVAKAATRCRRCMGLADPRTQGRIEEVLEMVRLRQEEHLTNKEIGERMGVPVNTVAGELCRMRAIGFHVDAAPYNNKQLRGAHITDRAAETLARGLANHGITPDSLDATL